MPGTSGSTLTSMSTDPLVVDAESPPDRVPFVFIVDDDRSVRDTLQDLIESIRLRAMVFESADEFLRSPLPDVESCLVLDIRLPGMSGLDFQDQLARARIHVPVIFMTGFGDVPMSVRAMKAGAVDFLSKPFRDQDMLDAIFTAIDRDRERREDERQVAGIRKRYETLTPRERELMGLVTTGLLNKQIAVEVDLAEATVKVHRAQIMRKMQAGSVADLVRMAQALGLFREAE
jgi:FixJ family two-component response regulator